MKNKINLFDVIVVMLVVGLIVLSAAAFLKKENQPNGRPTVLEVTLNYPDQAKLIYPEAAKLHVVYLDSVIYPVKTEKVEKITDISGQLVGLNIYLRANGAINGDQYVFNGIRVLIGQKAEIHGSYFAPAVVSGIKYAN